MNVHTTPVGNIAIIMTPRQAEEILEATNYFMHSSGALLALLHGLRVNTDD